MIVITGIANAVYIWLRARSERWHEMKRFFAWGGLPVRLPLSSSCRCSA